jgi:putative RNA 2'-phosphotransferase
MDLLQLSKSISHALRHEPWLYELELDNEGWVSLEELLTALRKEKREWRALSRSDIETMMAVADVSRFELREGKIRASYGYSTLGRLAEQRAEPPTILYHGTSPASARIIAAEGLRPMRRRYVHLSGDVATAERVGRRKSENPVILSVHARDASAAGVKFYQGNDVVWLADYVPPVFIVKDTISDLRRRR